MRLVIDLQGAQTASRVRGIGRYTLELVQEMARQKGEHEILLALNAKYADTIEPIRAAFADLLPPDAIHVFEVAGPVGGHDPANDARRKAAEAMLEAFLTSLQPDVIFIPSLFEEFGGEAVTSVHGFQHAIPTAVVLYDLIPLIHRQIYLADTGMERWYFGKLDHLKRADLLLSISASSRHEANDYLNFPEHTVVNISTASKGLFCPIALTDIQHERIKNTYGIDRPFVMYTGGIDFRKNIDGLFRAFASLPAVLRHAYALVLVGREVFEQKNHFLALAIEARLQESELIFTGYVPDQDLALLYNACTLFVFPSWHEGFGLPVLEAMACGKAVIAANSSSLPEVVGREEALFAPRDDAAMAAKMAEVLSNADFRKDLERHGLEQARKFSWETSARRAWGALENLHAQHAAQRKAASIPPTERPRLAFVSPLPPEKTGIADYAAELLPELARHYEITVIVQQAQVDDAWVRANAPIHDAAWLRQHAQQFDRVVYQFGNSPFHSHMFDLLAEISGLVVMHDFYLSDLFWYMDAHGQRPHCWARALQEGHGWSALHGRLQGNDSKMVATYPCSLSVLQQALGIVVHSDSSRHLAQRFYGERAAEHWTTIPLLRQPAEKKDKTDARQNLGLSSGDFVVCSFGLLNNTKLNHRLLDAWLASPLAKDPRSRLVFVGENHDGEYGQDLLRKINQSAAKDRITITGCASTEAVREWLPAADVAVQLRALSPGETSGTVLDCMNYGLPLIVNAQGGMAELPRDAVWLLPDAFSDAQLIEALTILWQDKSRRAELGRRAATHIRTHHNPRTCADQYAAAIESAYARASTTLYGLTRSLPLLSPPLLSNEFINQAKVLAENFPPQPRRRQLLLDISELAQRDAKTGIQRVTRALLEQMTLNPPEGWAVEPVYATTDCPGYRYARQFMSRLLNQPGDWAEDAPVQVWSGDVFFGLDFQAQVVAAQESTLQAYRNRGIPVYFLVHDILPVLMPEVFPEGAREGHQRWLQVITRFDGIISVSRSVADELYDWLQTFGDKRERPLALYWSHSGADIANSTPTIGLSSDATDILATLKSRSTFLMVGTIEPRKGYLQTLQAFDQLWAQGADINLVIVGKEGWKDLQDDNRRDIPQTVQALRSHPELGNHLFWLEGISDEYLELVYAASTCLIAASYGEGFGLPLIEAARHGLPLLARDIPVFCEVTANQAYFFADSRDPEVIASAVRSWLSLYREGKHPRGDTIPHLTWAESAANALDIVLGKAMPYCTWMPDGVRRYWGADPRLHSAVGVIHGRSIKTSGKHGHLIYGPYERFEAGQYLLMIKGTAEHWTGGEYLDIVSDQGKNKLLHVDLKGRHVGQFIETHEFTLETTCYSLEVRFLVCEFSKLIVDYFHIQDNKNEITAGVIISSFLYDEAKLNKTARLDEVDYLFNYYRSTRTDCDSRIHIDYVTRLVSENVNKPVNLKSGDEIDYMFQYWDQDVIPDHVCSNIDHNKKFVKHHEMFNRKSAVEFIEEYFGKVYLTAFDLCWHPAMRSDYFRLLKLFIDGGLYLDADDLLTAPIRMPGNIANKHYLVLMPIAVVNTPDGCSGINAKEIGDFLSNKEFDPAKLICYFSNNYMLCKRFNPIIALCIHKATRDILYENPDKLSIHGITGPGLVSVATQVYNDLAIKYNLPACNVIPIIEQEALIFQKDAEDRYISDNYIDWRSNNCPPAEFSSLKQTALKRLLEKS